MDTDSALSAAIAHHRRGDAAEAEEICREILQSDPDDVRALRFLAMLSSRRGDAERAIGLFRRAIVRAPEDPDLHLQLGRALSASGLEEEAEESCRQAIAIDPGRPDAHADLGVMRQRAGDLPGAIAGYREALRLDSSRPLVHYNLATALRRQGDIATAIEHAARVVNQLPGAPAPRILLAELRLEAGEVDAALTDCERCLKHEARNRRAIALQAVALARLGDHESSRALFDLDRLVRFRRVDPPSPYPDAAAFDAALAESIPHSGDTPGGAGGPGSSLVARSGEFLRGAGGAPGALAARFAEAAKWYFDRRPRDVRHRFLRWRPRDFHVEGDALRLPGGDRTESEVRERGWLSGLYAFASVDGPGDRPEVELGVPPARHRGETRFERRAIVLEQGRLVLFPSYLYHSLRSPESADAHFVITLDAVPD